MATRTRVREQAQAQGGDARVEEYLEGKGVGFTFLPDVKPQEFDATKSFANNARFVALDDARVEGYADAMRRGEKFPPVIAYGPQNRMVVADGNHRLAAAIKARRSLGAYHITSDAATVTLITFEANTRHGLPTSPEERISQALYLMDNGATINAAAAALNVRLADLKKASTRKNTSERFIAANIPAMNIERLGESTRWRLAMVNTDEGFAEAVRLAVDAKLATDEVFALVSEANLLRSSAKQVEFFKAKRGEYADRINGTGGGVLTRGRRGPRGMVALAVGQVMNLPEDFAMLAESYQPAEREDAVVKIKAAAKRLTALAAALSA